MASTETGAPTTKVMSGTVGAAAAALVIWGINTWVMVKPPLDAGSTAALTTVITFIFGYYMPPAQKDKVV